MNGEFPYTLIRSDRKTLAIQIGSDGAVIVRAPLRMTQSRIDAFVTSRQDWIGKTRSRLEQRAREQAAVPSLSANEIRMLAQQAADVLPKRAAYYARLIGVTYGRITIRCQKTRWGSCSSAGNLNFNCLLMLAPERVQDSVVVHELCHRKEMNHSARFYQEVLRIMPDYREVHKWLKQNGPMLMARAGITAGPDIDGEEDE